MARHVLSSPVNFWPNFDAPPRKGSRSAVANEMDHVEFDILRGGEQPCVLGNLRRVNKHRRSAHVTNSTVQVCYNSGIRLQGIPVLTAL